MECLQCGGGRAGAHCERCKEEHFLPSQTEACQPCDCNPAGSTGGQCDAGGQCPCRPGVSGRHCDSCTVNTWNFPTCRPCQCFPPGSRHNTGDCRQSSGSCQCKQFVTGENCDQCVEGYFQVSTLNLSVSAGNKQSFPLRSQRRISSVAAPVSATATPLSVTWPRAMLKVSRGDPNSLHFLTKLISADIKSQFLRGPDDWTAEENGRNIRDRTIFNAYKKIIGKTRETL